MEQILDCQQHGLAVQRTHHYVAIRTYYGRKIREGKRCMDASYRQVVRNAGSTKNQFPDDMVTSLLSLQSASAISLQRRGG